MKDVDNGRDSRINFIDFQGDIIYMHIRTLVQSPNKLTKKRDIRVSCRSNVKAAPILGSSNFILTNQVETFVVSILPNEITCRFINKVTDILREPSDLHVVRWNGRQNRRSKSQPTKFIKKAVFPRSQPSLHFFDDKVKITFGCSVFEDGKTKVLVKRGGTPNVGDRSEAVNLRTRYAR